MPHLALCMSARPVPVALLDAQAHLAAGARQPPQSVAALCMGAQQGPVVAVCNACHLEAGQTRQSAPALCLCALEEPVVAQSLAFGQASLLQAA